MCVCVSERERERSKQCTDVSKWLVPLNLDWRAAASVTASTSRAHFLDWASFLKMYQGSHQHLALLFLLQWVEQKSDVVLVWRLRRNASFSFLPQVWSVNNIKVILQCFSTLISILSPSLLMKFYPTLQHWINIIIHHFSCLLLKYPIKMQPQMLKCFPPEKTAH